MTTLTVDVRPGKIPAPTERPPNIIARELTGRPYISHSQLALMRACPRRFAFTYAEHAKPDFLTSSLVFGGAVHAAAELHYRCLMEGLSATTPAALMSAYRNHWTNELERADKDVPLRFNKNEDHDSLTATAQRMIDAFLASPISQPHGRLIGVEEPLRVTIDPNLPDVLARVDLVTQADEALNVVDLKTSRSKWTPEKAIESGDQLLLYGQTVASMSRHLGLPVRLHFAVITKAKKPVVQVLEVPADQQKLAAVKQGVAQVWEAITAGNFYPSPNPMNCTSCPFRSRCPVFGGGSAMSTVRTDNVVRDGDW